MAAHNDLGKWGEDRAADYLRSLGYTIVARDWKSGHRDIDIVAIDGDTMVFVEVKTRSNRNYTDPEQAVDYFKLRNLQSAINHYIKYFHVDRDVRFDVVTVVGTMGAAAPEFNHLTNVPLY